MNDRPPFPEVVDSSLISAIRSCGRKAQLEYLLHWKSKAPNVHLHAGKAFAHGCERVRKAFFEEGASQDDAVAQGVAALWESYGNFECPEDSAKSAERMAGALEFFFSDEGFPLATERALPLRLPSGNRAIEFSFLEPIDFKHPVTGDPILYSGRFDQCVEYAGGAFGEDDKTTSQLGARWADQWHLRSQFMAYTWGARKGGLPLQGFLVRGVSILKTKYEKAQAVAYFPPWMLDRWYEQMLRDLRRFQEQWESGLYDYNLDHSCQEFGGCIFRQVCQSQFPEPWLQSGYERRRWDPVLRIEEVVC